MTPHANPLLCDPTLPCTSTDTGKETSLSRNTTVGYCWSWLRSSPRRYASHYYQIERIHWSMKPLSLCSQATESKHLHSIMILRLVGGQSLRHNSARRFTSAIRTTHGRKGWWRIPTGGLDNLCQRKVTSRCIQKSMLRGLKRGSITRRSSV